MKIAEYANGGECGSGDCMASRRQARVFNHRRLGTGRDVGYGC